MKRDGGPTAVYCFNVIIPFLCDGTRVFCFCFVLSLLHVWETRMPVMKLL